MTDLRDQLQQDLGSAYTLEHELTGGGMSRVFVARDNSLGRQVVIKILPPEMAAAVSNQRFRREIQLAANLQHAHIVPLHSAGETNGLPYFTMPYVKGESLKAHLVKVGELPLAEAIRILREVASALAYAHENNIVHRDIKPDNVLISGDSAVVTDFGVAKALSASSDEGGTSLTSMGIALGTPAYMAPEQATADPHTDHRADIYALGIMAYEMITGTTPFANRSPQATLAAHVTEVPDNVMRKRPNTPPGLASLVMRCLEKRPADRPQTAREVMSQLDALSTPSGGLTPTASHPVVKQRTWLLPAIAAALVVMISVGAWYGLKSRGSSSPAALEADKSIAVLPFKNLSGDASNEYLGDGLSEELLNVLSQIPELRVAARASAFQFKGKTTDIREIGSNLGVANVLDGSVRKSGDRIRVTAQLIDTKSGFQLWTETFDRTASDVMAVQDEITTAIAQALKIRFTAERTINASGGRSANPEAFELYLKGAFASNRGSEEGLKESLRYFNEALAKDSAYAPVWAKMAGAYLTLTGGGYLPASEAIPEAEKAIGRALALSPDLPAALLAQVSLWRIKGDLEKSEAAVRSIIEKYPNLAQPRGSYALTLLGKGRVEEAIREMRTAARLDPMSAAFSRNFGLLLSMGGRHEEAIAELRRATSLAPQNFNTAVVLTEVLSQAGRYAEALEAADRAVSLSPDDPFAEMTRAYAYAKAGQRDKAIAAVRRQETRPDADNYAYEMAAVYSALGEKDLAFAKLDRLPNVAGVYLLADPMMAGLRDDPRFDKVLEKWKLKRVTPPSGR